MFVELDFEVDNYQINVEAEVSNIYDDKATFEYAAECGYDLDVKVYQVYVSREVNENVFEMFPIDDNDGVKDEIWDKYVYDRLDKQIWEQLEGER